MNVGSILLRGTYGGEYLPCRGDCINFEPLVVSCQLNLFPLIQLQRRRPGFPMRKSRFALIPLCFASFLILSVATGCGGRDSNTVIDASEAEATEDIQEDPEFQEYMRNQGGN